MNSKPIKPKKAGPKTRKPPKATSAAAGVAGKLGDRYEAWWTVLHGVLPVLRDAFASLRVERPGLGGIEFEVRGATAAPDEGHQCKRTHSSSWTIKALKSEGFLPTWSALADAGTHVVFGSSRSSVVEQMAEKARRFTDAGQWIEDLEDGEDSARILLEKEWSVDAATVHRRLRLTTFTQIGELPLRSHMTELLSLSVTGDPDEVFGLLRSYIEDHFVEDITADALWTYLRKKGHQPATGFSPAASELVRELTASYIESIKSLRSQSLTHVVREETDRIVSELRRDGGPSTVVAVGRPGGGKSNVIAEVARLLVEGGGTVVGALRLDQAEPATKSTQLGAQPGIGYGDSPPRVIARASNGGLSVLVVDQAETASVLSGRGSSVREALRDILQQARTTPGMKILIACRTEDLRFDANLQRLFAIEDPTTLRIDIGELSDKEVSDALASLGLPPAGIPKPLLELCRNPFNLTLFSHIYERADPARKAGLPGVRTRHELLAEYHTQMSARMRVALGPDVYPAAIMRVATAMSDTGTLSVPAVHFASSQDTLHALRHEGVLIEDKGRLRFFHEAMFDYASALALLSAGQTVSSLLAAGDQELIRRGQVRSLLTLVREEGPESASYLGQLREALGSGTRSHIRAAVLSLLAELDDISDAELGAVLEIAADTADPMHLHATGLLTTEHIARRLARDGLLDIMGLRASGLPIPAGQGLVQHVEALNRDACLSSLVGAARHEPNSAAIAALPVVQSPEITSWLPAILRLIFIAGQSATGPVLADLFIRATQATTAAVLDLVDTYRPDVDAAAERYGKTRADIIDSLRAIQFNRSPAQHALNTIAVRTPEEAPRTLRAWLDAAATINEAIGSTRLLSFGSVLGHEGTGLDVFKRPADRAPVAFVEQILPVVINDWESNALPHRWTPSGVEDASAGLRYASVVLGRHKHSLEHEVVDALFEATRTAAAEAPDRIGPMLAELHSSDILPIHELLAHVYADAANDLLDQACAWVNDHRVRGLPDGATAGWAWAAVAARVAASGSGTQRDQVLTAVRNTYLSNASDDSDHERLDREAQIVLARLNTAIGDDLPLDVRARLEELNARFGAPPDGPLPYEDLDVHVENQELSEDLTDDQWLHLIEESASYSSDAGTDDPIRRTANLLARHAAQDPGRFLRLGARLPGPTPRQIIERLLRVFVDSTTSLGGADPDDPVALVRSVMSGEPNPNIDLSVLQLLAKLAATDLPEDIVDLVPTIYERNQQPVADSDTREPDLDHIRGMAVATAADLLSHAASRDARLPRLAPMLQRAGSDHSEVGTWFPAALRAVHEQDTAMARDLADQWIQGATDDELSAPHLQRLAVQLAVTYPGSAKRILDRILASSNNTAKSRAGALAVYFSLAGINVDAEGEPTVLSRAMQDQAGRRGVASQLVHQLGDLPPDSGLATGESPDQRLLIQLADDDSDDVRTEIAKIGQRFGPQLGQYNDLFDKIADTETYKQHPGRLLHHLSQRRDDLPPAALRLCQTWIELHVPQAANIANRQAAEVYDVTDIVLAMYSRAETGSPARRVCLDLIDRCVEHSVGDIHAKLDEA